MAFPEARRKLLKSVTLAPALGFVPVAVHFQLFDCLQAIGGPATAQDVYEVHRQKNDIETKLSVALASDTLFSMGALGLLDILPGDVYQANDVTKFLVEQPSSQHGALHFTTEVLLGSAFLMRRLVDTDFEYPFQECKTPFQYAYECMGSDIAREHAYSIMAFTGRLESFNSFMTGKFGRGEPMPSRVQKLGYDLAGLLTQKDHDIQPPVIVDIGGGRGELLLELKDAFPHLGRENLVLQEYNPAIGEVPGVTEMLWDYKGTGPQHEQPVKGALVYSLAFVLHNLSNIETVRLLRKIAVAMNSRSRILIQELTKNAISATTHAAMIIMYGGRERTSAEWRELAAEAGLMVTFEVFPPVGECLVEMRKLSN
ncbi:O-methyltransferase [Aspergillus foveolatus]|uniref:O-methyltransferase n=1 Tax=Aspergillus foveolatus TaxID=210207 RepID=UPI003CCD4802